MKNSSNDSFIGGLLLLALLVAFAGPVTMAEKAKDSNWLFPLFLAICIRAFWFGAGALTVYLLMG